MTRAKAMRDDVRRVSIYIRVSTMEQAESGYSVGEQEARCRAYCDSRGWTVAAVYTDPGQSGATTDRPGLQALIAGLDKADVVLVYKLDRLSRSQKDTLRLIEDEFLSRGVDFVSVNETFDTGTPFGKAVLGMLSVFAELERAQIRERMSLGKIGRVKTGKTSAWSRPPFGYTNDSADGVLKVDPLRGPIAQGIVAAYLGGEAIASITNRLNEEGHVGKTKPWHHKTVRNVLSSPTYTGVTAYKGEIYDGGHDALVSQEDWEQVQRELERRQKIAFASLGKSRPFQAEHLLSGLLYCGACGRPMLLVRSERVPGGRVKRYRCAGQLSMRSGRVTGRNGCTAPHVRLVDLEEAALGQIELLRVDPDAIITAAPRDTSSESAALEAELVALAARLERLADLYIDGGIDRSALDARRADIEKTRAGVLGQLAALAEEAPALPLAEVRAMLAGALGGVHEWEAERQHRVVRQLIERIDVHEGRLVITWRFA